VTIQVPPFIQIGDRIRVDASEGKYLERVGSLWSFLFAQQGERVPFVLTFELTCSSLTTNKGLQFCDLWRDGELFLSQPATIDDSFVKQQKLNFSAVA